jgi:hypothetical protein
MQPFILIDRDAELARARAFVDRLWTRTIRPMLRGWRRNPA